jgi:class 3 adenylate cyclase
MVVGLADIAGFAKACKGKSDLETFSMLNTFYDLVSNIIRKGDGTVVKFMGDSALVLFPEDKAKQAVDSLRELSIAAARIWAEFNEKCTVRIKAHVGSVVIGLMGPDQRLDVIGNTLNQMFLMPWDGPELSAELKQLVDHKLPT